MNRKLVYLLIIFLAIASISVVSAVGGISVNGVDFNTPSGFEEISVPNGMDNMLNMNDAKAVADKTSKNWVMFDAGDKLVNIPAGQISESKNMTINNKEGTYNTFSRTNADGKVCHFFDYEQNNKKVRVIVFSDDDGQSLLKEVIK